MTVTEAFALALQHHQAGRLEEAETIYRQILDMHPEHADALHYLGVIAHQVGRDDDALEKIRQAVALNPNLPGWQSNLGEVHRSLGNMDEAIAAYRRAIGLKPDFAEAWSNLGCALWSTGQFEECVAASRRAIELKPDHAEAHTNLGNVLGELGRFDEAIAEFRCAIGFNPNLPDAWSNLGSVLYGTGRLEQAIEASSRAIRLRPQMAEAYNNLGIALAATGRHEEALAAVQRAVELRPGYAMAHNNLGHALKEQGRIDEAAAAIRRALELKPDLATAHSNLLLILHYSSDPDPEMLFREHRQWDAVHARPLAGLITPHTNDPSPGRRLRIGYVSPDFREHSVALFMESLLASHDPAQVEVFYYAELLGANPVTERLRERVGTWCKTTGMKDAQVAERIRADGIDILVDLAGHTAYSRILVFARKPAPVQVTYLGYCDTTGMGTMDYRFTDAHADPPGTTEHLHTERLVRLPDCAWCFRPSDAAPPVGAPPARDAGCVTLGCFNVLPKITGEFLALWSRILQRVPGSRLLLKNLGFQNASVRERTRSILERSGVAAERVELVGYVPTLAGHLALYNRVDIALDTYPYHGTTTTCEALWQGVPVVTLAGTTHASRVGVSLLTNLGLGELIAQTPEEYEKVAVALAADVPRLAELRSSLRERMAASLLMDAPRFARNVEDAYRGMWRAWCACR